jgi:hypothetical protein
MVCIYKGVVKDSAVRLDENVRLPEGAAVEVHVHVASPEEPQSINDKPDPFEAVLKRRAAYAGRRIGIDEIIEEEKQDREERFDHWLLPSPE